MLEKTQTTESKIKYSVLTKNQMLKKIVEELFPYFPIKIKKIIYNWPYRNWIPEENTMKDISVSIKSQKKNWNAQKRLRLLRFENKSDIEAHFVGSRKKRKIWKKTVPFVPFWESIATSTPKEYFVNTTYNRYLDLRIKDRIDFFKTYIGQMMLSTEMHSQQDFKNSWFSVRKIRWKIRYWEDVDIDKLHWKYRFKRTQKSTWKTHFFFAKIHKKSWIYENLIQKRERPLSANKFILDRPNTAFQLYWKQQQREPWKNTLLFRRALYWGFGERLRKENKFQELKIKLYLRLKNPRWEKRNQLYKRSNYLLTNFRNNGRVLKKKAMRIKQVVGKIIWPLYGHLRIKQITNIYKKSRRRKSNILTQNEIIINHFEKRLDVVVYRLNLAPTILWARRLIQNGSVFVVPRQDTTLWESMHASLKKVAFPLKLRDPKLVYSTTIWPNSFARFRFLSSPQKNIAYLLQPGDLIQCLAGNSLHQFKTKSELWNKPLPKHLLTKKHGGYLWEWRNQQFAKKAFNSWDQMTEHFNSAIFLHAPQFRDLNTKDRIKESFFRWTTL